MKDKPVKVLLIEDNPGDARLIQELLLENRVFKFNWVKKLSDAKQFLEKENFDVIISDLSLPDSHGITTAISVCKMASQIPVIVLTGNDDEETAVESVRAGAQDYLVKGKIDTDLLIRSIKYAIERKKTELEHRKMEENLKNLNETLKLVNNILRHDILNNLTAISISLENYREFKDEKSIQTVFKALEKSVNLIKQMRQLEMLVDGGEQTPYDAKNLIKSVIESYSDIDFKIEGNCTILADNSVTSVVDNIIRNAIIHGKTDRIDIKLTENKDYSEIRIADYGRGIPDEIKNRVFLRGFSRGETGTGLGLFIVKKVMERLGGDVFIEDNTPSGSIFVLRLKSNRVMKNETS